MLNRSIPNRARGGEGEADSRVASGGLAPNKFLMSLGRGVVEVMLLSGKCCSQVYHLEDDIVRRNRVILRLRLRISTAGRKSLRFPAPLKQRNVAKSANFEAKIALLPGPTILAFFDFLAFFVFRFSLRFWGVFPVYPRILGVPQRNNLCFFSGFPLFCFFCSKKQGLEGQGFCGISLRFETPKGPSRTKNTVDSNLTTGSKFATAIVKHYGGHTLKSHHIFKNQDVSEYGFGYGSKRWKSQISMDSQLRTQRRKQPPQSFSKGNFFVRVRFGGVPSTVEEVVRVRFCCLLSWKTNTGNTGRTVLGHRPI